VRASRVRRLLFLWGPVALYAGFISYLSAQPSLNLPSAFPDKLAHGVEFGVLAALLWRASAGGFFGGLTWGRALAIVGGCGLYAAVDEIHQSFVPGRDSSLRDAAADMAGAMLSLGAMWTITQLLRRRSRPGLPGRPVLTLLSKEGCRLCDDAEEVLRSLQKEIAFTWEKVDIATDSALARYAFDVPVVLIEGRKVFKHRIDPDKLRRRLLQSPEGMAR
jgi:VanZ family protein